MQQQSKASFAEEENTPVMAESNVDGNIPPMKTPISSAKSSLAFIESLPNIVQTALNQVAQDEGFTNGRYTINVEDGTIKGDGFIAEMIRASLSEGDRRNAYLCKIPSMNEARRQQDGTMEIFEREITMYNEILPAMFTYQEKKGIGRVDGFFNIPKCYYARFEQQTQEAIIVMEDLRSLDYRMYCKQTPVDFQHAQLLMEHVGRYHAVSLAMKRDQPEEFERFKIENPLKNTLRTPEAPFLMVLRKTAADALETLEPHEAIERTKMQQMIDNMMEEFVRFDDISLVEPFGVLRHGDCWINNMLYRYKDDAPENIILLDWQVSCYGSPVLDLVYFIFCCTDEEFRRLHYVEMLDIYHNSLSALLKLLGHDPQQVFPRSALDLQLQLFGRFGLMLAVLLVPLQCTASEDLPDLDDTAETFRDTQTFDAAVFTKNANQIAFRKRMSGVIRDTIRYGYM
ncbi:uncharacterized protein LOC128730559 [Anopheles nili]|uniref:uncharacterized protein LOC128730559 n=1 Tax=Anopheles nili TaxID=185578 RepID=UPI00237A5570|nr:uncharacterized protein LOC128730559 [Anopheles nili]